MIEIENNVPMTQKGRKAKELPYPFKDMKQGQSFHISEGEPKKISAYTIAAQKRYGMKFAVRSVGDSDPKGAGIRVYCLEGPQENVVELVQPEAEAKPKRSRKAA